MTTTTTRPCWHCATPHESDTVPALCSDPCRDVWRSLYQLAYAEPSEILDGPIHPNAVMTPVSAADQGHGLSPDPVIVDEAMLDRLEAAFNRRARCDERVLELNEARQLGYLAASDEWTDHRGEPLIPPLQEAATRLASAGMLPEFAEWFPAPTDDNCDIPAPNHCGAIGWWGHTRYQCTLPPDHQGMHENDTQPPGVIWHGDHTPPCACCPEVLPDGTRNEPRPADEPQALVGAEQAAAARLLPLGMPERAELLGECPPRPPEPPVTGRPLVELRGMVQARPPWWQRWFSRG
ncbi:hypothetical protein ACIRG5_42485 [Lentzea sp. NPDC102401]|uniref:hypothetical protein n=1 Tax=Lentzea sp. NPDC102401 TaxID=3364128 RepID=UPI00381D0FBF